MQATALVAALGARASGRVPELFRQDMLGIARALLFHPRQGQGMRQHQVRPCLLVRLESAAIYDKLIVLWTPPQAGESAGGGAARREGGGWRHANDAAWVGAKLSGQSPPNGRARFKKGLTPSFCCKKNTVWQKWKSGDVLSKLGLSK